ncbi:hypothetical protein RHMOL_Rhmol08G0146800 [Rhododendron molle]|uniref:Uncharacterized protein n=1 Tax=Rhododendron molle TaxID=49168 RepID=A0ACC0MQI2_RHOML|nr:hypothetical protein RHMOL_Rhmol08G0146800 [Rhododendron molle]
MSALKTVDWQWQNAVAGSVAGLATVAFSHPLDVVRTRFQVSDGRTSNLPLYKNTPHALWTIARTEGLRGLYAGFYPAVLGSTISWGLYFFFYSKAKERYSKGREELTPYLHLASAAEAGALPYAPRTAQSTFTGSSVMGQMPSLHYAPLVALRSIHSALLRHLAFFLELLSVFLHESPLARENKIAASDSSSPESAIFRALRHQFISDAVRTILKEEGWSALYKGLVPGLFLVTHGAIQFTAYEELRKAVVEFRSADSEEDSSAVELLVLDRIKLGNGWNQGNKGFDGGDEFDGSTVEGANTIDYATLGASSKVAAILLTYPFQVIRSRLQQRPSKGGIPMYMDSWHVVKETARFEGFRGFYRGITPNMLKNVPAASITFIVYENVLNMLKYARRKD